MDEHPRDRMARIFNCEPLGTKMAQDLLDEYMRIRIEQVEAICRRTEHMTWRDVLDCLRP